jgi:predicted phage terminase large subunit-like protein
MNLLQDLQHSMPSGLGRAIGVKPEESKVDRMAAQSAKIEAGQINLQRTARGSATSFQNRSHSPTGPHDDQVDSVSQFLRWWQNDWAGAQISWVAPIVISRPREWPL